MRWEIYGGVVGGTIVRLQCKGNKTFYFKRSDLCHDIYLDDFRNILGRLYGENTPTPLYWGLITDKIALVYLGLPLGLQIVHLADSIDEIEELLQES